MVVTYSVLTDVEYEYSSFFIWNKTQIHRQKCAVKAMAWNSKEIIADLKQTSCFSLSMTTGSMLIGLSFSTLSSITFSASSATKSMSFLWRWKLLMLIHCNQKMQWYYAPQTTTTLWDITWQFNSNIGICFTTTINRLGLIK